MRTKKAKKSVANTEALKHPSFNTAYRELIKDLQVRPEQTIPAHIDESEGQKLAADTSWYQSI